MSMFMGGSSQYSYAQVDPQKVKAAEIQFSATAATFNRMLATCEAKCINDEYGESDLTTGEAACVDRCVSKYVKANALVGTNFQTKNMNPFYYMGDYDKIKLILDENSKK